MFIAVLFTIAKCWKQPKCSSVNEWIKKLWYIYTMEFYAAERKKGAPTLHDSMDGTGELYVKWNKPGSEREFQLCKMKWALLVSGGDGHNNMNVLNATELYT